MNTMEDIKQQVRNVVLEILPNVNPEEVLDDSDIFGLGLDSVNAMILVMNLQEGFGIMFQTDEITFDNFRTIAKIVDLIAKKQEVYVPA